jgi:predicted DNA-binding transcriptional regulator YafY
MTKRTKKSTKSTTKSARGKSAYNKYLDERLKDPKFRKAYEEARAQLNALRKPPVKMRAVGWGVMFADGNTRCEISKYNANIVAAAYDGTVVRLYVRKDATKTDKSE